MSDTLTDDALRELLEITDRIISQSSHGSGAITNLRAIKLKMLCEELLALRQEVARLRAAKPAVVGETYTRPGFSVTEEQRDE